MNWESKRDMDLPGHEGKNLQVGVIVPHSVLEYEGVPANSEAYCEWLTEHKLRQRTVGKLNVTIMRSQNGPRK